MLIDEKIAIGHGFTPDNYYTAVEKMIKENLFGTTNGIIASGRRY